MLSFKYTPSILSGGVAMTTFPQKTCHIVVSFIKSQKLIPSTMNRFFWMATSKAQSSARGISYPVIFIRDNYSKYDLKLRISKPPAEPATITIRYTISDRQVCGARGPRPRFPRVWKTRNRIGTISKSQKLVECIKGLSNVKEEVYGALDSFVAWELEFPLIVVKKTLKTFEIEREWKRIIQVVKWMFSKGQGKTMGTYYTLLNALAEDGRLEEAEELWMKIFSENLENLPRVFFMKMMSLYYDQGMYEKMFEVFADMEELGIRPDMSIVNKLGDVFQKLGMSDKYDKLKSKYPPPTWEYRYIKGKRVRIHANQIQGSNAEIT